MYIYLVNNYLWSPVIGVEEMPGGKIDKVSVLHRFVVRMSQNLMHWVFTLHTSTMRVIQGVHGQVNSGSEAETTQRQVQPRAALPARPIRKQLLAESASGAASEGGG